MDFQSIIAKRRDGLPHSKAELTLLANGAANASIPDYQLSAWLMAAYLRPLSAQETVWLTEAMADSGERVNLTGLPKPWVDKHSTGGVGDKTSIVLLPLLASCGLTVIKMSGRGLGITGGTVDKLGSIPGFRLDLTPDELKAQAARMGLAITGQTPNLAPADKALYALRDSTSTVSSIPLIVSSILSKKLAGGAETIVLDVKCGKGAFMTDIAEAHLLAESLFTTAKSCGLNVRLAITDMEQPLGSAIGNSIEVAEAVRVLKGESSRFSALCVELAGITLAASGIEADRTSGKQRAAEALANGNALLKASEWFLAQGATVDVTLGAGGLPVAPEIVTYRHIGGPGWISGIDAGIIGLTVIELGGGRKKKSDPIDPSVGVELHVEVGSPVVEKQPLFTVHAANRDAAKLAHQKALTAIGFSARPISCVPALLDVI